MIHPSLCALVAAVCLVVPHVGHAQQAAERLQMLDLATLDLSKGQTREVSVERTTSSDGQPALKITTKAKVAWPGFEIKAPGGKWDLAQYEYISVDLHNTSKHDVDIAMRVDNPGANGLDNCITETIGVQPDQHVTFTIPLKRIGKNTDIKLFGLAGYPQGLYPDGKGLDPSNIVAIKPFTPSKGTPEDNTFILSNVYAAGKYEEPKWLNMSAGEFFPWIDKFGQFRHKDWPGKVHSDEELQQHKETEAAALAADPGPKTWSKFGGWANGPKQDATGHFRTVKVDGKWWLVDPEGYLFFSTGLTGVSPGYATNIIDDRDNWFTDLPTNDGPTKQFYGKSWKSWQGHYAGKEPRTFNFSSYNLSRKYGPDFMKPYGEVVQKRLRNWGINTIANWSDGRIYKLGGTPYTAVMFYSSPKLRDGKGGFPDPFAPEFAKAVAAGAKQFLAGTETDPWCIGYFVDNELPWGGDHTLAQEALRSNAKQPGKQEFRRVLEEKYKTVDALNTAWGTKFGSWDDFLADSTLGDPKKATYTDAAKEDMVAFVGHLSQTYFKTIRDVLKAQAPDKLYLGCRSVGGARNMAAAAIKYCDVSSYNRYAHSVQDMTFPQGLDGPMLIGEFHFAASDRGLFWNGLVSADSQADRGRKYIEYVQSALKNPQMVGVHWFQYGDQGVAGRVDGENGQVGFVDICDTPYAETIAASRKIGEAMYDYRTGK